MRALSSLVAVGTTIVVALSAFGCSKKIGDPCVLSTDCSPAGDRFCDTSSESGYCTIDGCDVTLDVNGSLVDSCPGEALCVSFYTQIADEPCNPYINVEMNGCKNNERCLCDLGDRLHPGYCQAVTSFGGIAHCAPEDTERRWCQVRCTPHVDSNDLPITDAGDCRAGFVCRQAGDNGADAVYLRSVQIPPDGGVSAATVGVSEPFCNDNQDCLSGQCFNATKSVMGVCAPQSYCGPVNP